MNKKGDFIQIFFLLAMLFISAILFLLIYAWSNPINEAFSQFANESNSEVAYENIQQIQQGTPYVFDYFIFFIFIGGTIGLMISAVRTNFNVGVLFLFLLVTLIAILVSSGLVNIYQGFAQAPTLTDLSNNLTLTNIIFSRYLPLFVCVISGIVLILMYSKTGSDIAL